MILFFHPGDLDPRLFWILVILFMVLLFAVPLSIAFVIKRILEAIFDTGDEATEGRDDKDHG